MDYPTYYRTAKPANKLFKFIGKALLLSYLAIFFFTLGYFTSFVDGGVAIVTPLGGYYLDLGGNW